MLNWIRESQLWNAIFRHGVPRDRRTRVMANMSNVFLHLHPVAVRKSGIRLMRPNEGRTLMDPHKFHSSSAA